MEQSLVILRDTVPNWLFWPALALYVLGQFGPKIFRAWVEILPSGRAYLSEKERLELTKLEHEIAAIRKANTIEDADLDAVHNLISEPRTFKRLEIPPTETKLSISQRFLYAALGAFASILPILFPIVVGMAPPLDFEFIIGLIFIVFVIGVAGALVTSGAKNRIHVFLNALVIPLIVFSFLSSVSLFL